MEEMRTKAVSCKEANKDKLELINKLKAAGIEPNEATINCMLQICMDILLAEGLSTEDILKFMEILVYQQEKHSLRHGGGSN